MSSSLLMRQSKEWVTYWVRDIKTKQEDKKMSYKGREVILCMLDECWRDLHQYRHGSTVNAGLNMRVLRSKEKQQQWGNWYLQCIHSYIYIL